MTSPVPSRRPCRPGHKKWRDVARKHGLSYYPDPAGERYVYATNRNGPTYKKGEATWLLEAFFRALAKAGGDELD